ncbi:MAG: penicillin-binding protein 1C [Rhodospirillaceae bacterium]
MTGRLFILAALLTALSGAAFFFDRQYPPSLERLRDVSVMMTDRAGVPLKLFASAAGTWRLPVRAEQVAPVYLDLLLAYEDKRFFNHGGVDAVALGRAVLQYLSAGRVVSGASTLTMQVARLLEPHRRSLSGKLLEMVRAFQLEARYDKRALLDMYLTLAPFGGALEGVRAGALAWFGKPPRELSLSEAALLVALPRAPGRLRPDRAAVEARAARDGVLARAVAAGVISARAAAEAVTESVPTTLHPFPDLAPHLAESLRLRHPGVAVLTGTLDGALQAQLEGLVRVELRGLVEHGGLAILVADNDTRTVLAHIGAPDPHDDSRNGWIDMTRAVRSPGSALKPFIYGIGFDDRVIHPETVVADVSTRFGDYAPANFDRGFHGELTIREALQQSLNVPAVMVLDRVGPARFADRLRSAGTRLVFPRRQPEPGLPLALGGVSVSLWDLTALYLGLAHGGEVVPLSAEPVTVRGPESRIMSPEAAAEVRRILQGTPPPPGLVPAGEVNRRPAIALKTGTSYGFRDAWAFGVGARHTVGVWVGRPDGTPSPDRYGRNTAAPLLYRVFDLLDEGGGPMIVAAGPRRAPALLRRIEAGDPERRPLTLSDPEQLRLVFPTPGVVFDLDREDGVPVALSFSVTGGRRPLTWVVNGRPIAVTETRRELQWQPDGPGFTRLTVIDADGRSAGAEFQLK